MDAVRRTAVRDSRGFGAAVWLGLAGVPLAVAPGLFVAHDVIPKLLVLGACGCVSILTAREWMPGIAMLMQVRTGQLFLLGAVLEALSLAAAVARSQYFHLSLEGTTWRRFGLVTQVAVLLFGIACAGYFAQRPERIRRSL